ncbi:Hypothetical predicted protein [Lecanosticta acicola]|uniref:CRIB domain-containing protein n=1 Tax=Lecanosticta acicola TaxID=111012 RepID=A0AAI8YZ88_9PEZI|nr:Hypothetical predicted protein [Lecanosticta acicola]
MTMAWVPHEIRNLMSYDDPSSLTSPQPADDHAHAIGGTSPVRTLEMAEDTSTESTHTPEQGRRKRLSLFSRSNSDASRRPAAADISDILHATMAHGKDQHADPMRALSRHQSRPSTAQSTDSRKKPNDALESLRNSLFRGRKRSWKANAPRPSSRLSHPSTHSEPTEVCKAGLVNVNTDLIPLVEGTAAKKEGQEARDVYLHRKKSSISPPFNFQHVTHTAKKHLPKLETVDEKDLKTKFWAVNAYQKPKEKLHGIKAQSLETRPDRSLSPGARAELSRRSSQASALSQPSPTHTVTRSVDETLFDETQETKFDPDAALQFLHEVNNPQQNYNIRQPKHDSSSSSLASNSSGSKPQYSRVHASFDHGSPNRRVSEDVAPPTVQSSSPTGPAPTPAPAAAAPELAPGTAPMSLQRKPLGQSFKANQSLPPIPARKEQPQQDSKAPTNPTAAKTYSLFPPPPGKNVDTPPSNASKRSSKSVATTSRSSLSSSTRRIEVFSEASWEDEIDFAYERGAEAMLDDWDSVSPLQEIHEHEPLQQQPPRHPSPDGEGSIDSQGGGVRLSAGIEQPAVTTSDSSSAVHTSRSNTETPEQQHKRGSSVGHKGFAAARTASQEAVSKSPSLALDTAASKVPNTPPPKFSVTNSDLNLQSPSSSTMQLASVDHDLSGYISDPESTRTGGSRHRKSSSYGSYDSSGRSLPIGSDTTRWSSCSTSSMPDLLHSKRKSRSSVGKMRMSRTLESVPHSPDFERSDKQDESNLTVPPTNRSSYMERAATDSVIMRRPANGDRQCLYSAGRIVQRRRSSPPSRLQRGSSANPPVEEVEGGWI